jgi:hypothetical protein
MRQKNRLTKKQMKDAIKKSGYLFESEISRKLGQKGYFIENSPSFFDEETHISREIDLLVEKFVPDSDSDFISECYSNGIFVHSDFVFELKSNNYPLVLMTEEEFSPNNNSYDSLKIVDGFSSSKDEIMKYPDLMFNNHDGFYTEIFENNIEVNIFSQYCSFDRKKQDKELFALHPDSLHSSLRKICMYCDKKVVEENELFYSDYVRDNYEIRHHIYLPILLIRNNLYKLTIEKKKNKLTKAEFGVLKQNYYFQGQPSSTLVIVLTEKGLFPFLKRMENIENNIRHKILDFKQNSS